MALNDLTPVTRMESILNGDDIEPVTREEYFVQQAVGSGGGGGDHIPIVVTISTSGMAGKTVTTNSLKPILDAMRADYQAGHTSKEIGSRMLLISELFGVSCGSPYSTESTVQLTPISVVKMAFNGAQTLCRWRRSYTFNLTASAYSLLTTDVEMTNINTQSWDLYPEDSSDITSPTVTPDNVRIIYIPLEV